MMALLKQIVGLLNYTLTTLLSQRSEGPKEYTTTKFSCEKLTNKKIVLYYILEAEVRKQKILVRS
jgi:hypothetical protein